ncbi:MAG: YDG domain-containing protein [Tannerella sp.]|nr:YDG domain-containing protein [Tannerella sp.]
MTAINVPGKVYDGTTDFVGVTFETDDILPGDEDDVTISYTATFASAQASENAQAVTIAGVALQGTKKVGHPCQ